MCQFHRNIFVLLGYGKFDLHPCVGNNWIITWKCLALFKNRITHQMSFFKRAYTNINQASIPDVSSEFEVRCQSINPSWQIGGWTEQ